MGSCGSLLLPSRRRLFREEDPKEHNLQFAPGHMGNPFSSPSNHQEGHFRNSIGDSLSPGGAVASTPSDRPVIPTAPVMTNANPPSFSSWQDGNLDYNLDHRTCQPTQVRIPQNTPEVKVAKVTYGPEGYDGNKCLVSGTCGSGPLDRKALAMIMMDGDDVPEIQCPCGSGPCIVLTSGTKKNPNRRFYKCPAENVNYNLYYGLFLFSSIAIKELTHRYDNC